MQRTFAFHAERRSWLTTGHEKRISKTWVHASQVVPSNSWTLWTGNNVSNYNSLRRVGDNSRQIAYDGINVVLNLIPSEQNTIVVENRFRLTQNLMQMLDDVSYIHDLYACFCLFIFRSFVCSIGRSIDWSVGRLIGRSVGDRRYWQSKHSILCRALLLL